MLYWVHLICAGFKFATLVVIGTDCKGSYKSNYHTITNTTAPWLVQIINKWDRYQPEMFVRVIGEYYCAKINTWWPFLHVQKIWILHRWGVLNTTLCDQAYEWLAAGRWFSPGTLVSSTNKTDRHDNWNIVENGFKHHNPNPNPVLIILLSFFQTSI
jgi:hypothetical protein